jgi:hypothetical protein
LALYTYDTGTGAVLDLVNYQTGTLTTGGTYSTQTYALGSGALYGTTSKSIYFPVLPVYNNFGNNTAYSFFCGTFYTGAPVSGGGAIVNIAATSAANNTGPAIYAGAPFATAVTTFWSNGASFNTWAQTITQNTFQTWGVVVTGSTTALLYGNGKLDTSVTGIGNTAANSLSSLPDTGSIAINNGSASSTAVSGGGISGFVPFFAGWNRRLTAAEARQLHDDPYCFLIYPEDEIFSTLKGAAGASTYNVSITESGSASDTESNTAVFAASDTEAGAATDTDTGKNTTASTVTEAGSASDTETAGLLSTASATEAGSASDTESAGNVTAASDTEAGSATDTDSAIGIYAASDTEAGSASDTDSSNAVFVASDTEAGSATDSNTTGQSGAVSEAGSASDTESAIAVFGASVAEAGSATDTDSGAMVTAASATEAGSAGDTDTGANVTAASLSEAGSASDTASTVAQTYNDSVTEAGSASDTPSNIATFRPAVSEAGSATDAPSGVGTYAATDTELGAAADSTSAAGSTVWNDSVVEAGNATDVVSFPGNSAVGWFDEWDDNEPRWWEELQAEYQERWNKEDGFPEPSKAKKAVHVRKATVQKVKEAGASGLLGRVSAKPVAELVKKTIEAPKLVDAIRYAREIDEYLERLRDEEDEDDILMMALAA